MADDDIKLLTYDPLFYYRDLIIDKEGKLTKFGCLLFVYLGLCLFINLPRLLIKYKFKF